MATMATVGSALPGRFVLGKLSHVERIGLAYEALPNEGEGVRCRALVLHPQHADDLRPWFERYALLIRGLAHPNLLYVHAIGFTENDLPVVVTEWVEGRSVRNDLDQGRIFQPSEAMRILAQVASALDYLHERATPILHRALQPELLMVNGRELRVKLLGVGEADRPVQPPGRPGYLSPEEIEGGFLGPAADVFGFATLAYELFTGRPAFGDSGPSVVNAVRRGVLPFIALGPNELLAPLDAALHRAWRLDASQRPERVGTLFQDLVAALERVPPAEVVRRRSYLDSPLRARSQPSMPPAPTATRSGQFYAVTPAGGIPASRSGQYNAVRVGPTPAPVAVRPASQPPPRSATSSAPPPPNGQAIPLVPKAPRLPTIDGAPEGLKLGPPTRPTPETPMEAVVEVVARPSARVPAIEVIETEDAVLDVDDNAVSDDPEVNAAVLADDSLPPPPSIPPSDPEMPKLEASRSDALEWEPPGNTPLSFDDDDPAERPTQVKKRSELSGAPPAEEGKRKRVRVPTQSAPALSAFRSLDDLLDERDGLNRPGRRARMATQTGPAYGHALVTPGPEMTPSALFEHPDRPSQAPPPRTRMSTQPAPALSSLANGHSLPPSPLRTPGPENTPSALFEHPDRPAGLAIAPIEYAPPGGTFTPIEDDLRATHEQHGRVPSQRPPSHRPSNRAPSHRPPDAQKSRTIPPGAKSSFEHWSPVVQDAKAGRKSTLPPAPKAKEVRLSTQQLVLLMVGQVVLTVLLVMLLKKYL